MNIDGKILYRYLTETGLIKKIENNTQQVITATSNGRPEKTSAYDVGSNFYCDIIKEYFYKNQLIDIEHEEHYNTGWACYNFHDVIHQSKIHGLERFFSGNTKLIQLIIQDYNITNETLEKFIKKENDDKENILQKQLSNIDGKISNLQKQIENLQAERERIMHDEFAINDSTSLNQDNNNTKHM